MFLQLLLTITLIPYAYSTCFDNGDKDIGGLCYKFVTQLLAFNDARNWCHYQNPVTSSNLAYVPNQFTSNFVASYAHTAFGLNQGNFWIGLSRNSSSSPFCWDNRGPVTFTNFGTQLGQNYVAEDIVNAKWITFEASDKKYFVCSYDPHAPFTFSPPVVTTTQQVPITEDTSCKPSTDFTYLFAFSNDLDPQVVIDVWSAFFNMGEVAIARFDVRDEEDIAYFEDAKSVTSYVLSHLPNSQLGFNDTTTGSDILRVIEKFYSNKSIPVCGAVCFIYSKRYSNDADISKTVSLVRQHHGRVNAITSIYPSGGTESKTLYSLTSQTNGMCNFGKDEEFKHITYYLPDFFEQYPVYCANPIISGQSTMELPSMTIPSSADLYVTVITVQDHGPVDSFKSIDLLWFNEDVGGGDLAMNSTDVKFSMTIINGAAFNYSVGVSTMKLEYNYSTEKPQAIQVRVHGGGVPNDWPPYCD